MIKSYKVSKISIISFFLFISIFNFVFGQRVIGVVDMVLPYGTNYGVVDMVLPYGTNFGVVDMVLPHGKNIYLTESYDFKDEEKNKVIQLFDSVLPYRENIGIVDMVLPYGENFGIVNMVLPYGENFGFTDSPKNADYIIITDIDLITKIFSNHSILKTLIKNIHPYNEPTTTSKSNIPKSRYNNTKAFKSKIDEDNDDILKLDNGAIIEVTMGFLGFIGFRKDCIVFKSGYGWKIWIEGKKVFPCDILKEPDYFTSIDIKEVTISEVSDNGEIIYLTDGSVYEVSYQSYETTLWLGYSSALLINGYQIINLDEGSEMIDVIKIK